MHQCLDPLCLKNKIKHRLHAENCEVLSSLLLLRSHARYRIIIQSLNCVVANVMDTSSVFVVNRIFWEKFQVLHKAGQMLSQLSLLHNQARPINIDRIHALSDKIVVRLKKFRTQNWWDVCHVFYFKINLMCALINSPSIKLGPLNYY